MTLGTLLAAAAILSFLGYKSTYWPLKFIAGLAWLATAFFWLNVPPASVAAGSPTHTIVLLMMFAACIAFMLMTFWGSRNDNGTEVGTGFRMTMNRFIGRPEQERTSARQAMRNRNDEYRDRVNRRLGREG